MGVFQGFNEEPSVQLWTVSSFLESSAFLVAPLFLIYNKTNENKTNENKTNENKTNGNKTNGNQTACGHPNLKDGVC
jgi:hypothetical protein